MGYIALKRLQVGDGIVEPGERVPEEFEARFDAKRRALVSGGFVSWDGRPAADVPEPAAAPEPAAEPADEGYGGWTVRELKEELDARGLPKSGRKADLVARLEEDDSGEAVEEGDDEGGEE